MEDTIDSILSMCKVKPIDNTLEAIFQTHIKYTHTIDIGQKEVHGYCRTIKQLLTENNFQFDFDSAFNILSLNLPLEDELYEVSQKFNDEVITYKSLPDYIINQLSNVLNKSIKDTIVEPYVRDVSLDDLDGTNYIILRDSDNRLWIVSYVNQGEYRITDLQQQKESQDPVKYLKDIFAFCKEKVKKYDK
jgi:hypothetical protein